MENNDRIEENNNVECEICKKITCFCKTCRPVTNYRKICLTCFKRVNNNKNKNQMKNGFLFNEIRKIAEKNYNSVDNLKTKACFDELLSVVEKYTKEYQENMNGVDIFDQKNEWLPELGALFNVLYVLPVLNNPDYCIEIGDLLSKSLPYDGALVSFLNFAQKKAL